MAKLGVPGFNRDNLAYVSSRYPVVPVVESPRSPTVYDTNYPLWTEWRVDKGAVAPDQEGDFWKLVNFVNGQAIWVKLTGSGSGPTITLSDTAGTKVLTDALGNIQLEGTAGQISVTSDPGNNKLVFSLSSGASPISTLTADDATVANPSSYNVNLLSRDTSDNNDNGIQTTVDPNLGDDIYVELTNRLSSPVVQTTDATVTTLQTFALGATDGVYEFDGRIQAYDVTNDIAAIYYFKSAIRTTSSVGAEIGTDYGTIFEEAGLVDADFSVGVNINTFGVEVQGLAGTTIRWQTLVNYRFLSKA